jgi:hypothetical protein
MDADQRLEDDGQANLHPHAIAINRGIQLQKEAQPGRLGAVSMRAAGTACRMTVLTNLQRGTVFFSYFADAFSTPFTLNPIKPLCMTKDCLTCLMP